MEKKGKKKEDDHDLSVKVIIVGDAAVGKISIYIRFVFQEYMKDDLPIGWQYRDKTVNVDRTRVKMGIWDFYWQ